MLTRIDAPMLAAAFPIARHDPAMAASESAVRLLHRTQWTERFAVRIGHEQVLIPSRLHFASHEDGPDRGEVWRLLRALQTRSGDGFERQRALRDVLTDTAPWEAPFIVALIGEYIVEMLDNIALALNPGLERLLGAFVADNPAFWLTTKRRVTSYWNAYYRSTHASELRRPYRRADYVGFRLTARLETVALGETRAPRD